MPEVAIGGVQSIVLALADRAGQGEGASTCLAEITAQIRFYSFQKDLAMKS
jgi:hypothetical protein